MKILPKARTTEIVENDFDKELLIYDLTLDKVYVLNETSKIIFKACDGKHSFDDLKRKYDFTDDLIYFALDELRAVNLLGDYSYRHFGALSRRKIIRRVGLASLAVLPVIAGMSAPGAANAASLRGTRRNGTSCNTLASGTSQECASGFCVQANFGGQISNTCCTQGSSNGSSQPTNGNFIITFTTDGTVCATQAAMFCCVGTGRVSSGRCYCG